MYKKKSSEQITFYDYNQGFGFPINPENRWVLLANKIPWDEIEQMYAPMFDREDERQMGNVAISARVAFGVLAIRRILHLSDRATVKAIQEGPYLQYFLGMPRYEDKPPFDPSMMSYFRRRLDLDAMGNITDMIIQFEKKTGAVGDADREEPSPTIDSADCVMKSMEAAAWRMAQGILQGARDRISACRMGDFRNSGCLIIDATCSPVNIRYPQDFSLLNEAREKLDKILDRICSEHDLRRPRSYRRVLRKAYLSVAKSKKRSTKVLRSIIRKLLYSVRRNLRYLDEFLDQGILLNSREEKLVETIRTLYEQQKYMFDHQVNRVENRIVSIHMPFIRPIVRGKTPNPTEFGPKYDVSVDEAGNSRIEYFSYDAYNESTQFVESVENYRKRTGHYPEKVLADTIYRTRANRAYCKEHGIQLSGPRLGRPSSDPERSKAEKALENQDMIDRIEVERRFSRSKRCFGLERVFEKTPVTVGSSVGLGILLDNLVPAGF